MEAAHYTAVASLLGEGAALVVGEVRKAVNAMDVASGGTGLGNAYLAAILADLNQELAARS